MVKDKASKDEVKREFLERLKTDGPTLIHPKSGGLNRIVFELADAGLVFVDLRKKPYRVTLPINLEEGEPCPHRGCDGVLVHTQESCHCGIEPAPCSNCENAWLECSECAWDAEEGTQHVKELDRQENVAKFSEDIGSW